MKERTVAALCLVMLILPNVLTRTTEAVQATARPVRLDSRLECAARPAGVHFLPGQPGEEPSYIAITFSDGLQSAFVYGYPALSERGWRGVAIVPTALVGHGYHMSLETLTQLDVSGWDVASHLDRGADCTQLPPEELYSRLVLSRDWLMEHGFERGARTFSPPALRWETTLTPLAFRAGYEAVLVEQSNGGRVPPPLDLEIVGCANRRDIGYISQAITLAASTPGTLLVLSFHNIVASEPRELESDIARLNQVLGLVAESGVPVVTISDLLDSLRSSR